MSSKMAAPTIRVRGVQLRADPAREPCFKVVHLYTELWRTFVKEHDIPKE